MKTYTHQAISKKYNATFSMEVLEGGEALITDWVSDPAVEIPTQEQIDVAVSEYEASEEFLVKNFNADLAIGREAQVFNLEELDRVSAVSYTINELIKWKNFWGGVSNGVPYAGLKQMLAYWVLGGKILQGDSDKLAGILAEQGIVLE